MKHYLCRKQFQVLGCLGRRAVAVVASLGERRAGLIATHAAKALVTLDVAELSCFLELLLDAGEALGAAGAIGGRRAIMGVHFRFQPGLEAKTKKNYRREVQVLQSARSRFTRCASKQHMRKQPQLRPSEQSFSGHWRQGRFRLRHMQRQEVRGQAMRSRRNLLVNRDSESKFHFESRWSPQCPRIPDDFRGSWRYILNALKLTDASDGPTPAVLGLRSSLENNARTQTASSVSVPFVCGGVAVLHT